MRLRAANVWTLPNSDALAAGVLNARSSIQNLTASVAVSAIPDLPPGLPAPVLPGHTTGVSDVTGRINISDLVLIAQPWTYHIRVTLLNFPLVSLLQAAARKLCRMVGQVHLLICCCCCY